MSHHNNLVDLGAIATFVATLIGWVPAILAPFTAVATFLWAVGRVWEMYSGVPVHETATARAALKRVRKWRSG